MKTVLYFTLAVLILIQQDEMGIRLVDGYLDLRIVSTILLLMSLHTFIQLCKDCFQSAEDDTDLSNISRYRGPYHGSHNRPGDN